MFYNGFYSKDFDILKVSTNKFNDLSSQRVTPTEINFDEKNVIILCGNGSKSLNKAEFYAHLCRNWLADYTCNNNFSTYSIFYPNTQPLFEENSFTLNYYDLTKQLFDKILFKNNKRQNINEIKKKLNNVTFFGHSAGGYAMNNIMQSLNQILTDNSFPKDDIAQIYNNIVFIAYSPYSFVDAPIKTIYVTPIYDSVGSLKHSYSKLLTTNFKSLSSIKSIRKLNATASSFAKNYKKAINNADVSYFANKRTLIATPNLLYYDGKEEDHNFAGAIIYPTENTYQTNAGKLTAEFLSKAFNYCLTTNHEDLNMLTLYSKVASENNNINQTEQNKDL